jgi:putative DNA primase/helicase
MCEGADRFRFDDKDGRGTYFCSQCGPGDGVEFVKRFLGVDFKEAAREIEKHLGVEQVKIRSGRSPGQVRDEMNAIWTKAHPIERVEAVMLWWARRIGDAPNCPDLRATSALYCHPHGHFPGMVALVRDVEGKPVNLHRTYLAGGGFKADIPEPRRVMDTGLPRGCAVRLSAPTETLGIAEGLETAEACRLMFGVPTWAALNAPNLAEWAPPEGVKRVVIFGDHDVSFTGQWAAYALAKRLRAKKTLEVEVRLPDRSGDDWNDVLMRRLSASEEIAA